jgi:hypothetical protein
VLRRNRLLAHNTSLWLWVPGPGFAKGLRRGAQARDDAVIYGTL